MVRLVAIAPAGGRSDLIPSPVSLTGREDSALVRFIALLPRSSITGVVDANIVVLRKRMRRSSFFKNAHICFWIVFGIRPKLDASRRYAVVMHLLCQTKTTPFL